MRRRSDDHVVSLGLDDHETAELLLTWDGDRYTRGLSINGISCQIEYLPVELVVRGLPDTDPDFTPQSDAHGFTYRVVPLPRTET